MKKVVSLLLVLSLTMSLLAGCGESRETGNEETKVETKDNKEAAEKQEEKEEPVVIEWLAYNPDAEPEEDAPVIKYVEEKFNVDLEVWFMARENLHEALNIKIAGGEMPDIFKPKSGSLGNYVKQGVAGEVPRETIKEYAPDLFALYEEYYPGGEIWVRSMYEGKNYGYSGFNTFGEFPSLVIWREDWLNNLGYDEAPTTIDEFEEVLYRFAHDDPDGNGKDDTYGMSDFAFNMVFGAYGMGQLSSMSWFGTNRVMIDGKPTFACIQPETKEALAKLADWYAKGIIDPEFITSEHTSGHWATSQAFLNGRIGLTGRANPGHWELDEYDQREKVEQLQANNPDGRVLFALPPVGPTGLSGTNNDGAIGSMYMFTSKATADPNKVQKILEMANETILDFDHAITLSNGYEGEHFEYRDKNGYQKAYQILPEGIHPKTLGIGVLSTATNPADEREFYKAKTDDFLYLTAGRTEGMSQPKVPSTEAYSQYAPDLRRMAAEAFITIVTGEKPIEYFDEFVENYLENGGQETIDQMQAAYAGALGN
ncbi:extracellular solute-binding protein [Vallitalea okinawensis]|uniref:extracellular solute-binding protein n=1 Tax=Vallitalea okinawensis TaxID=2078660 RepID=UPI000CFB4D4A|nr:extracellular solute-binding protein [Vallitalea okinawensis]